MGTTAMLNIELHVRAADSNSVLQHLEETGSFQVIYPDGAPPDSCNTLELALQKFAGQGEELHISGWVPADKAEVVSKAVVAGSAGRASIEIHSPEECRQEKGISSEDIPVLFRHGKFLSGFRPMVQSYATPCYGDIDPTPFAAFFFICFFSLMFGDLGQGAVIFCLGLAMRNAKKGFLANRSYWPAFVAAGLGSMLMGLLEGSFFANEEVLIPFERVLTKLVFQEPRDRFFQILPEGGIDSMLHYFALGLAAGVLVNLTGLVINIVNLFRRKEYGKALFSEAGVFSGLLYFWAAGIGARFALGMHLAWFDAIGLGLPLLALLFSRPLEALTDSIAPAGHPGQHRPGEHEAEGEGLLASLTESLAELFRTVSEHLANTLTFLMVGAYALSHALLGTAFFRTAEIVRLRIPGGAFWQILVYVIGNFIIMTLEGTIVVVQCIRLQDNEFFSKFFNRTGKPFSPLCFEGQAFIRQFDKPGKGAMK